MEALLCIPRAEGRPVPMSDLPAGLLVGIWGCWRGPEQAAIQTDVIEDAGVSLESLRHLFWGGLNMQKGLSVYPR